MRVGYFPFKPGGNPYQTLFANAIEHAGHSVLKIPPSKWFPLQKAYAEQCDILQLDWPHDWYRGKNAVTRFLKRLMYLDGLRRLKKIPVVWTAHNLVAHDSENIAYEKAMIQKLIDVTDGIIVMSESSKQQLEDAYRVPPSTVITIIPHGHYIDVYPNKIDKPKAREILKLSNESCVALSLGRLMPYKGLEELIVDFAKVARTNSELLVAGSCLSASYREHLIGLAESYSTADVRIKVIAEFIDDDQLQVFFNAADFVVLPFKNILNSGSLMLAMSFGKVVVAPDIGSIKEIACEDGWVGYEVSDTDGLRSALINAHSLTDFIRRENSIANYTRLNFSWERSSKLLDAFYQSVLLVR